MVKVVDVNITLDGFYRTFGRKPTEAELGVMMRQKARQEGQVDASTYRGAMDRSKISQDAARIHANKRPLKEGIALKKRAFMINKMMLNGIPKEQILDILTITDAEYERQVKSWALPRKDAVEKKY